MSDHPREVLEYADWVGIDPEKEPYLMWIAVEGLNSPIPYTFSHRFMKLKKKKKKKKKKNVSFLDFITFIFVSLKSQKNYVFLALSS
jgi:hypothetical protein